MKKRRSKELHQLTIEAIASNGYGLARVDGKVIFVEKAIPGDVVDVKVYKNKSDYGMAFPIHYHTKSPIRSEAFCSHFGTCGGCTWQDVEYEQQLIFKHDLVADAFRRIGKLMNLPDIQPVIGSPYDRYYRNKLEYTFSNSRWLTREELDEETTPMQQDALGFHIPKRFDKILDISYCYLQPAPSNEIRLAVRAYGILHNLPFYDLMKHEGCLRNLIIRNTSVGDLMVILSVAKDDSKTTLALLNHLQQTFPEITSLYYAVNTKMNDSMYDLDMVHAAGLPYITEKIGDIQYRLGPKSFFQTNTAQAEKLYEVALQMAGLGKEDVVYDLYTGLGSIALLAAGTCKKVVGVETIEASVEDARKNATLNGITNCTFVAGDMMKVFNQAFIEKHGAADVVITDPPRAGMHKDVCTTLLELSPRVIIYVSCNPVTQARDLQLLNDVYQVTAIQPVDMFPQTYHIENVVKLERRTVSTDEFIQE
jgi:23S rRNA (uracil1939-C5)-methyltransferase